MISWMQNGVIVKGFMDYFPTNVSGYMTCLLSCRAIYMVARHQYRRLNL